MNMNQRNKQLTTTLLYVFVIFILLSTSYLYVFPRTEIEVKSYTKYKELFGRFLIPALILGISTETLNRSIFKRQT